MWLVAVCFFFFIMFKTVLVAFSALFSEISYSDYLDILSL